MERTTDEFNKTLNLRAKQIELKWETIKTSYLPKFYEIFPYRLSRGEVVYNKKLLVFQTAAVILACANAVTMTFVDQYVILRVKNTTLYLLYLIRRLSFPITILFAYIPIINNKISARRLLKLLDKTAHFDASTRTTHSKYWRVIDCTFLMSMVAAIIVQEKGNHSGTKGHLKITSNFFMNLILFLMVAYYRRMLWRIADQMNSLDLNSTPAEVCRRHMLLYKAAKAVVKMFSFTILSVMTIIAVYVGSNSIYMLNNKRLYPAQFIVSSCYLIYYIYLVAQVVVGSCCAVLEAADRVTEQMIETCRTSNDPKRVRLFKCHTNLYGNLGFRPLGLFVLEKSFLTEYFTAVASYVAISLDYTDKLHN